jgi:hypothetical protein
MSNNDNNNNNDWSRPTLSNSYPSNWDNNNNDRHQQVDSEVERALRMAAQPLQNLSSTRETINAGGFNGLYLNKNEVDQWRGAVPIENYPIHHDPNPEVIHKHIGKVNYEQVCATRWLNPGPAPQAGIHKSNQFKPLIISFFKFSCFFF